MSNWKSQKQAHLQGLNSSLSLGNDNKIHLGYSAAERMFQTLTGTR